MATQLPREYTPERIDGGYKIRRVPIFAEHERTFKSDGGGKVVVKVDRARLERIAANYNARVRNDGWRGPIHGAHNGNGADGPRLGYLDNYRVEKSTYNGQPTYVLFADYIIDGDDSMSAEERLAEVKRYPYRSIEINLQKDEASSLALLDREAPFFKFPNFKTAETYAESDGLCYALYGERYSVLTDDYSEVSAMKDGKGKGDEAPKGDGAMSMEERMSKMEKDFSERMSRLDKFMDAAEKSMKDEEDDEEAEVEVNVEKSKSKAKGKKYQGKSKGPKEDAEEPAAVMNSDDADHYAEALGEMRAQYQAEIRSLKARIGKMEEEQTRAIVIADAANELSKYALGDTETLIEELDELYTEGGEKAISAYIRATQRSAELVTHYSDDAEDEAEEADVPSEVQAYAGDDAKYSRAASLYTEFHNLPAEMRRGITPAQFIEDNITTA